MKARRMPTAPDVSPSVLAILLDGWGATPPVPCPFRGFAGGFGMLAGQDGPATLWRQHETYLRQVARTWGWSPQWVGADGVRRFYGEHCANGEWYDAADGTEDETDGTEDRVTERGPDDED
jgi:hypothetical protein